MVLQGQQGLQMRWLGLGSTTAPDLMLQRWQTYCQPALRLCMLW